MAIVVSEVKDSQLVITYTQQMLRLSNNYDDLVCSWNLRGTVCWYCDGKSVKMFEDIRRIEWKKAWNRNGKEWMALSVLSGLFWKISRTWSIDWNVWKSRELLTFIMLLWVCLFFMVSWTWFRGCCWIIWFGICGKDQICRHMNCAVSFCGVFEVEEKIHFR